MRAAAEGLGATLDRPPTSMARPTTGGSLAEVSAVRAVLQAVEEEASDRACRSRTISLDVNGEQIEYDVPARRLLVHFLRDDLGLTGTHVGCDTGNCGACTVHLNGDPVKSCMLLAVQADGATIATVEGLAADGELTALQQAFNAHHALQCGYCTPGMLMSATRAAREQPAARRRKRSASRSRGTSAAAPGT